MILLTAGAAMLAKLMAADPRGPDTAWLLSGPTEDAVLDAEDRSQESEDWPLAAE